MMTYVNLWEKNKQNAYIKSYFYQFYDQLMEVHL